MMRALSLIRMAGILGCLLPMVTVQIASANGINPPRAAGTVVVRAICEERSGNQQHEILRARIATGRDSSELLTIRRGAAVLTAAIGDIESIDFPDAKIPESGFAEATVSMNGRPAPAAVQVRSAGADIQLRGFTASGSKIAIALSLCKRIEFAPVEPAGAPPARGTMKH